MLQFASKLVIKGILVPPYESKSTKEARPNSIKGTGEVMKSRACQDNVFDWLSITSAIPCLHPSSDGQFSFGSPGPELQVHEKEEGRVGPTWACRGTGRPP